MAGGSPEFVKSSFSQKCSQLSQYLKERGGFGDLTLGITCNIMDSDHLANDALEMSRPAATTMNLFPVSEKLGDFSSLSLGDPENVRSMDLFPQQSGFAPSRAKEDVQKRIDSSVNKSATSEPQTAQMTIFYAGQVVVFNDFPADKAKEVMLLASQGSSLGQAAFPPNPPKSHPSFAPDVAETPTESGNSVPPPSLSAIPTFPNNLIQERSQPVRQPIAGDLPIARKASLHRFLEKRKDRITARAPYQTSSQDPAPTKPAENKPWLGLAAQPLQ